MGDSLGFHIIFVIFGLTLPVVVSWFEFIGIKRKDKKYLDTAKLWSKAMSVLVIAGVISGTIIAIQMSLVWPGILKFGGEVIGLPFMFETYAFLVEAVFLALYMATWDNKRITPWVHWMFSLFIIAGATMSAYAITSINGWMNLPTGFDYANGSLTNISVFKAMFSEVALVEFFHSMFGYYFAASLAIAGIYGFKILRSSHKDRLGIKHKFDWVIVQKLMIFALVALIFILISADLTGKYLAKHEPAKLATIELVDETTANAPFVFGGVDDGKGNIVGPFIQIPNALSILAGGSSTSEVIGLHDIPKKEHPPSYIRALFNIKLTLIMALVIGMAMYFFMKWRQSKWLARSLWLGPASVLAFLGVVIMELGWMITEIGRQPWAVRGYVTTEQALTKTHDITSFGYFFPLAYVALGIVTILALRAVIRSHKEKAS